MTIGKDQITSALARVGLPDGGDLISRDLARAITIDQGNVSFVIEAADPDQARLL